MDIVVGDFIWNAHKEKANVLKHGIDFRSAAQVFSDRDLRIFIDDVHSVKEVRFFGIGMLNGRILTVRFMYRNEKIRIFGAGYWRNGKVLYEKKEN